MDGDRDGDRVSPSSSSWRLPCVLGFIQGFEPPPWGSKDSHGALRSHHKVLESPLPPGPPSPSQFPQGLEFPSRFWVSTKVLGFHQGFEDPYGVLGSLHEVLGSPHGF